MALVLAASLSGASKVNVVDGLDALNLPYSLAIRSNQALWLPPDQAVYQAPWQPFERTLSHGPTEARYLAAVIDGKRHRKQDWLLPTDPKTLPPHATSLVMMVAPAVTRQEMGDHDGLSTWLE